jgi:hypothetical protein
VIPRHDVNDAGAYSLNLAGRLMAERDRCRARAAAVYDGEIRVADAGGSNPD